MTSFYDNVTIKKRSTGWESNLLHLDTEECALPLCYNRCPAPKETLDDIKITIFRNCPLSSDSCETEIWNHGRFFQGLTLSTHLMTSLTFEHAEARTPNRSPIPCSSSLTTGLADIISDLHLLKHRILARSHASHDRSPRAIPIYQDFYCLPVALAVILSKLHRS